MWGGVIYHGLKLLTLNLLETKVISLCHQYTVRPVCTVPLVPHLGIPKNDNGQFQNLKVDYSIKEIQQVKR